MHSTASILALNLNSDLHWTETLRDRTHVVIRPLCKQDIAEERAFIEALSPRSGRFRFFGDARPLSSELIERLADIDYSEQVAFAVVVPDGARQRFLGVSRYNTDANGMSCECVVTVLDEGQHKGLGAALMLHLIEVARARGIRHMYSIGSIEKLEMTDLARFLGFDRCIAPGDRTRVIHSLRLHPKSEDDAQVATQH